MSIGVCTRGSSIPVVFICDSSFVMQTVVSITSLKVNAGENTNYDIIVIAAGCSSHDLKYISNIEGVRIIETSLNGYKDIKQLAHIPIACLLKFAVCDLLPEYDKILYLDGDTIIRGSLAELYATDVTDFYAAAVFSRIDPGDGLKKINAGVMLFNARRMREDQMGQKLMAFRRSLGDKGSMDQQTFNLMLGKDIRHISARYNCMVHQFAEEVQRHGMPFLCDILQEKYHNLDSLIEKACIIHFSSGFKPWKYSHVPCGQEWLYYYKQSPFAHIPLSLKGRFGQKLDILHGEYQKGGCYAVMRRLVACLWHRICGKKPEIVWG